MRLISFHLTTRQIRDRSKTVTRRLGFAHIQPGELLQAVEKARGVTIEDRVALAVIRVKSVRREPLHALLDQQCYSISDVRREIDREGFPDLHPAEFVEMFCEEMKCLPGVIVNRIEFEYV